MQNQEPRTKNLAGTQNQEPRTENLAGTGNPYSYRNLILWEKGQQLALAIIRLVAKLPIDRTTEIISGQILRSVFSISANVAEGHGRYSLGAHRNHLTIAKGSACETDNFLDLLRRADYISSEEEQRLHTQCDEIIRMLVSKILRMEQMEQRTKRQPMIREAAIEYGAERGRAEPDDDPVIGWEQSDYITGDGDGPVLGSRL